MDINSLKPTQVLPLGETVCDQRPLSELEQIIIEANKLARSVYLDWFNQASVKEKFGKKAVCEYNNMNDIHYFINVLTIFRQELDKYQRCGCISDDLLNKLKEKYKLACMIGRSACKYDKLFSDIFKLFLPKFGYCSDKVEFNWEDWVCYTDPITSCYTVYEIYCTQGSLLLSDVHFHYTNYLTGLGTLHSISFPRSTGISCVEALDYIYNDLLDNPNIVQNFDITISLAPSYRIVLTSKRDTFEHGVFLDKVVGLTVNQAVTCDNPPADYVESYKIKCTRDAYNTGSFEITYTDPVNPFNTIKASFSIDFTNQLTCQQFIESLYQDMTTSALVDHFSVTLDSDCTGCTSYVLLSALVNNFSFNLTALTTYIGVTPVITFT